MFDSPFRNFYRDTDEGKFTNQSIECRGTVLHFMANLELLINLYIAKFFCGKDGTKMEEMILLILGDERMSLSSKAQVFHFIASHHDKKWYESYVSIRVHPDKKKSYSMNNDLVFVIEERNVFAHRVLDNGKLISTSPIPVRVLRFARLKNEIEPLDYTDKKYYEIVEVALTLSGHLFPSVKGLL